MQGLWKDALQSICGLKSDVFNKRHQPCPHCGGRDRFRWTDELDKPGDGGAICNVCGNDSGVGWIMKLTGEPYCEVINILGRFLGKVPQEYRVKANKRAASDSGYKFGAQANHESCETVMNRTKPFDKTPVSVFNGIGLKDGESYQCGVKTLENGAQELIHAIPCHMVNSDGVSEDMCNILFINEDGEQSFYARDFTRGSVAVTGKTDKTIYLCVDWVTAQHVHISTNQEVWACFSPSNLEIVAFRYKGDRNMRVVCRKEDSETLYMADDRMLPVMIPVDGDYKKGIEKRLYNPLDLIG